MEEEVPKSIRIMGTVESQMKDTLPMLDGVASRKEMHCGMQEKMPVSLGKLAPVFEDALVKHAWVNKDATSDAIRRKEAQTDLVFWLEENGSHLALDRAEHHSYVDTAPSIDKHHTLPPI
ncbi:unnamed protein product [Diplocarpon coronariae]